MFVRSKAAGGMIDAVVAVEGHFHFRPGVDPGPSLEGKIAYANSETKDTYGSCEIKPNLFSHKTIEALRNLMHCIEEDFGAIVFDGGAPRPFGEVSLGGGAETGAPLEKGLGG